MMTMEIELTEYNKFMDGYKKRTHQGLRLGQAFFDHFQLHKSTSYKDIADKLYELDGREATAFIREHFDIR